MPKDEKTKKPSKLWYLLPIFLGLISGLLALVSSLIGYFILRKEDKKLAKRILIIGIAMLFLAYPLSFMTYSFLRVTQNTDVPIVVMATTSMQHDNPEKTYYGWLKENLNYSREFVNSWPFKNGISSGDILIVKGSTNYNIGDVVVLKIKDRSYPRVSRIIAINKDGTFQTKSDNNLYQFSFETSVGKDQIYGKVVYVIPYIGKLKLLKLRLLEQ